MRGILFVIGLTGCDLVLGLKQTPDAHFPDVPAMGCYGHGELATQFPLVICPSSGIVPPTFDVAGPLEVDTDTSSACAQYLGNDLSTCVIVADTITVSNTLRAIGGRPLVLVATKSLTVAGTIDVSSTRNVFGAGAPPTCSPTPATASGNAGGAGGSLAGKGGAGGDSANGNGGNPTAVVTIGALTGGCRGSNGGMNGASTRGPGGGGVCLIAGGSITITSTGKINASGAGGRGGAISGGGGGGGSGGMICLDSASISIDAGAQIFANGGGGGEGGGNPFTGSDGLEPTSPSSDTGSGDDSAMAGDGGDGSVGAIPAGAPGKNSTTLQHGAGGGGGGAGLIRIIPFQPAGGMISPPPS